MLRNIYTLIANNIRGFGSTLPQFLKEHPQVIGAICQKPIGCFYCFVSDCLFWLASHFFSQNPVGPFDHFVSPMFINGVRNLLVEDRGVKLFFDSFL